MCNKPGQTALPTSCPVCAHDPLDASLCKPNKALRTTLKAFLRTEEKKREKERHASTPDTPANPPPIPNATTDAPRETASEETHAQQPLKPDDTVDALGQASSQTPNDTPKNAQETTTSVQPSVPEVENENKDIEEVRVAGRC